MKIRREFTVDFETWKAMINGCSEATVGVNFAKRGEIPVTPNIRDCAEKFIDDDATEMEFVSETGTRKPTNRGDRRKETAKEKRRLANIYKRPFHNDSVRAITRNGKEVAYVKEGDTWSWRKEWRRMNHRIRRHEGKRECYLYTPEATETETETEIGIPEESEILCEYTTEMRFADYPENGFYVVVYWPDWCMEAAEIHCCRLSAAVKAFENHKSESASIMSAHFNHNGYLMVDETIAYYKD